MTNPVRKRRWVMFVLPVVCLALLPSPQAWGDESPEGVNSRGVYAYYDAGQALAMARETGKPIFVVSIRGNDCAGGL